MDYWLSDFLGCANPVLLRCSSDLYQNEAFMNWIRGLLLNIIFALALSIGEDNDCIREEKPAAVY